MEFPDTIPRMLARAAREWAQRPYLQTRHGTEIEVRTFAEVARDVHEMAGGLVRLGVGPGERVALLGENSPEWVLHYLAITCSGATVIPLDTLMSPPEIAYILGRTKAHAVIVSRKFREGISPVTMEHGIRLLTLDSSDEAVPRIAGVTPPEVTPSDVAVIIFTSGTMGFSKGVMLTHLNLCSDVDGLLKRIQIHPTDNFHLLLPLHHAFSATVNMLVPLGGGARTTFATSYKSRDILDDVSLAGVTLLAGVPQLYENIMLSMKRAVSEASPVRRALFHLLYIESSLWNHAGINLGKVLFTSLRRKAGLSSLRYLISGGSALPPNINRYFQRLGFTLIQGYGLTETGPVLSVNPPHRNRIGSVGPAIPGVTFRIDSPDPATGVGEICVRGPVIMSGYFENPEETSAALRDGWFHTGDAGYLDKQGYLYITGRVKSVIVTAAGKNVHPEEIEAQLNASPFILESLVIGVSKKHGIGEELRALIVPDYGTMTIERQRGNSVDPKSEISRVVERYNASVPAYRRLRHWEIRDEELEKTSTRKIKRYVYKNAFDDAKA